MSETRVFPMDVLLTMATGRFVCGDFGKVYEIAQFMTGGPVWTHELGSSGVSPIIAADLKRQHPDLPTSDDAEAYGVDSDNWREWLAGEVARLGPSREVTPIPDYSRRKGPLETAIDMVGPDRVVAVVPPEATP